MVKRNGFDFYLSSFTTDTHGETQRDFFNEKSYLIIPPKADTEFCEIRWKSVVNKFNILAESQLPIYRLALLVRTGYDMDKGKCLNCLNCSKMPKLEKQTT